MKLVIFNVKFSPNLGDGLLAECLEAEILRQYPAVQIRTLDLAGRTHFAEAKGNRRLALLFLQSLPSWLRRMAAGLALMVAVGRLRGGWGNELAASDAVIIGGGNLFADADLNFPTKVEGALREAGKARLPVAIYGVGVSDNWSRWGARLFRAGLGSVNMVHVAVRDHRSQMLWQKQLPYSDIKQAQVCRDPGLLASSHYPVNLQRKDENLIGLCLTSPLALRYHAESDQQFGDLDTWLEQLCSALLRDRWTISLFTNGSPEDVAYLDAIEQRLVKLSPASISRAPRFACPADMVSHIANCRTILAHRMHACIAAYSLGIPHLGFTWDKKLNSFFKSTGRADFLVDPYVATSDEVARLVGKAAEVGIDPGEQGQVLTQAKADVAALMESLLSEKLLTTDMRY